MPYYNFTEAGIQFTLVNDNKRFIFRELYYPNQTLNCTFKKRGSYRLVFSRSSDVCDLPNPHNNKDICTKGYHYTIDNLGDFEEGASTTVVIILVILLLVIAIVLFIIIWRYYKNLQGNRLKLVAIDKNDRYRLYIDESEPDDVVHEKNIFERKKNKTDEKPKEDFSSIKKSTHTTTIGKSDSRNRFTKEEYMVAPESSNRSVDTKRGSDINTERRSDGVVVYKGSDETISINNNISNF